MKVRVKIALAVAADGTWRACGYGHGSKRDPEREKDDMDFAHELYDDKGGDPIGEPHGEYWIEADIETPMAITVEGVEKSSSETA